MRNIHLFNVLILLLISGSVLLAQEVTAYPGIPRIDVHTHVGNNFTGIANYLVLRDSLLNKYKIDLAMWINLGKREQPIKDNKSILKASEGRILCAISDFSSHDGLNYPPEELEQWLKRGFVGYKIWAGPYYRRMEPGQIGFPYIDDPAHEPTFAKMEEIGMIGASIHIADPNGPWGQRTNWLADPVEYWKEITAWRHVLERHPNLKVVVAHGDWLMCQDAQLDYLRNMFTTFPNLNVDLAATFQYYHLVNTENLRSFMIEWADRIIFATDEGGWEDQSETPNHVQKYYRVFRILETDELINGGFFGRTEIKGLALPQEVLEKIYYRNAMRMYPGVKNQLIKLGYSVQ